MIFQEEGGRGFVAEEACTGCRWVTGEGSHSGLDETAAVWSELSVMSVDLTANR